MCSFSFCTSTNHRHGQKLRSTVRREEKMGGSIKSFCGEALFPSSDVDRKAGTCQVGSWHKVLCTALITRRKDLVLQTSKD